MTEKEPPVKRTSDTPPVLFLAACTDTGQQSESDYSIKGILKRLLFAPLNEYDIDGVLLFRFFSFILKIAVLENNYQLIH